MLFNSYLFLAFMLGVLLLSRSIPAWRWRKGLLLLASYAFYAAWNPPFVLLLWLSTAVDWFVARAIHRASQRGRKRLLLGVSLAANLGLLVAFKYGGFLLGLFGDALAGLGWARPEFAWDVVLPVGISFYTFQTLSYTIDVYRGDSEPAKSPLDYALYVTFFPQLVAGPIVRANEFLPQLEAPRRASARELDWGVTLFVVGLFAKVVIADALVAPAVQQTFDHGVRLDVLDAWSAVMAFGIQVFADFFGYSTCAIGLALMLGFVLPDNFQWPYAARSVGEFWRRWHMTLSRWVRDYIYIPLGGDRRGRVRTILNLVLTMTLLGLWHGAGWTFIAFGALHGLYLAVERIVRWTPLAKLSIWERWWGMALRILVVNALVCVSWAFFRAPDLATALSTVGSMFGVDPGAGLVTPRRLVFVGGLYALMLGVHLWLRTRSLEHAFACVPGWVRPILVGVLAFLTFAFLGGTDEAFIYFQF